MNLTQFAEKYSVRMAPDRCCDPLIPGKAFQRECCHIFEHSPGRLAVCLLFAHGKSWAAAKRKALAAGFILRQDGDWEGVLLFDPENDAQARLAIELIGARAKCRRNFSPEERQRRADRMRAIRTGQTAQNQNQSADSEAMTC